MFTVADLERNRNWYQQTSKLQNDSGLSPSTRLSWYLCAKHSTEYYSLTTEEDRFNFLAYLFIIQRGDSD